MLSIHQSISPLFITGPSLQMRLLPVRVLHEHPMQAPKPHPMRSSNESWSSQAAAFYSARSICSRPQA